MKEKIIVKVNENLQNKECNNLTLQRESGVVYFENPESFLKTCSEVLDERPYIRTLGDTRYGISFDNDGVTSSVEKDLTSSSPREVAKTYQKVIAVQDVDPEQLPKLDTIRQCIKYILKAAFDYPNSSNGWKRATVILDAINCALQASLGHTFLAILWGICTLLNTNIIGFYEAVKKVIELQKERELVATEERKQIVSSLPENFREYENVRLYIKTNNVDRITRSL